MPHGAHQLCATHTAMWDATLEQVGLPLLVGLGPMKKEEGGRYKKGDVRPVEVGLPLAMKTGRDLLVFLTHGELWRCFGLDTYATDTGYCFRLRVIGMLDAKGSKARVYIAALDKYADIDSKLLLEDGPDTWRCKGIISGAKVKEGVDESGQHFNISGTACYGGYARSRRLFQHRKRVHKMFYEEFSPLSARKYFGKYFVKYIIRIP